jgi:hypothetical protein
MTFHIKRAQKNEISKSIDRNVTSFPLKSNSTQFNSILKHRSPLGESCPIFQQQP